MKWAGEKEPSVNIRNLAIRERGWTVGRNMKGRLVGKPMGYEWLLGKDRCVGWMVESLMLVVK